MKKLTICAIMIITLSILLSSCVFPGKVNISNDSQGNIKYIYNDKNISTSMSKEDSETIINIIDGRECQYDNPSCGFDGNISFSFGNDTFYPACDGCSIIKYHNKYFNVLDAEIKQIHAIMEKYGAYFPCI
ncbi:MAG: hypothetical protein J1E85_00310 [Ruminococcus sp.]|nr:hypothetical protein [Ruminococcus sp.]